VQAQQLGDGARIAAAEAAFGCDRGVLSFRLEARKASAVKRRDFITLLGGAAAWPLAARAQQPERMRRVGVLIGVASDPETKAWVATFRKRLDELGWRVGGNLQIDERWTAGDPERNPPAGSSETRTSRR